jgi:hypothetical protein
VDGDALDGASPLTDEELRVEAIQLGQMIADLFDGVHAGTDLQRRVKAIRAGSSVEETRERMTSLPSVRCKRCKTMIRSNDLARAYARHEETCEVLNGCREEG